MKIKEEIIEKESIGFEDDISIRARINLDELGIVLEGLVKIYSDPIGSLVRELTSNCYDSHVEAGVDTPIFVGFKEDENLQKYAFFKDSGMGLSPEEMDKVYMEYSNSTKRDKNEGSSEMLGSTKNPIHGAWGIGSKSPLAYTDEFYIDSVKNGIKHEYILSKGSDGVPVLDELNHYDTDEHNGVEVKIFLKTSQDKYNFENAFKEELMYFDNVYFQNCEVTNDFNIYEYETFKLRSDNLKYPYNYEKLHIVYGKAVYRIDFDKIKRSPINIPAGLKIPLGELIPIRSREDITYNDEAIELINNYIDKFIEEIELLYSKQITECFDLFEYNNNKSQSGYLKIDKDIKLDVSCFCNNHINYYHLSKKLKIKSFTFSLNLFDSIFEVSHRIFRGSKTSKFINYSLPNDRLIRCNRNIKNDTIKNKYIEYATIIRKKRTFQL